MQHCMCLAHLTSWPTLVALLVLQEIISIAADKLPNYEAKIKSFYEEHIHSDDEIRFILDGKGKST